MNLTEWIQGLERDPPASNHFTTIDVHEVIAHTEELVEDLARRFAEAKTSRAYLHAYAGRLSWGLLTRRLQPGPTRVKRGDFGEVVAAGWLEDYGGLIVPMKKLRLQIRPGQTLWGTDVVAFEVDGAAIPRAHFLESKLRTTSAYLSDIGVQAYQQLQKDRVEGFLEILQVVHEWLFDTSNDFAEPLTVYLESRESGAHEEDAHEIVLIIEDAHWDEEVLEQLAEEAEKPRALGRCTVHSIRTSDLANLIDASLAKIGLEVLNVDDE